MKREHVKVGMVVKFVTGNTRFAPYQKVMKVKDDGMVLLNVTGWIVEVSPKDLRPLTARERGEG